MTVATASATPAGAAREFTILDTITPVPLSTQFSFFGSGGIAIQAVDYELSAGPTFTLSATTTLTEIGGFLNSPNARPFSVELHRIVNAELQDPVIGQFQLSNDGDPLLVSYESAHPNLTLQPGTYAALFVAQPGDVGLFLGSATSPFVFKAGWTQLAVIDGSSKYLQEGPYAVRITGKPVPPVTVRGVGLITQPWPTAASLFSVDVTGADASPPGEAVKATGSMAFRQMRVIYDGRTALLTAATSTLSYMYWYCGQDGPYAVIAGNGQYKVTTSLRGTLLEKGSGYIKAQISAGPTGTISGYVLPDSGVMMDFPPGGQTSKFIGDVKILNHRCGSPGSSPGPSGP